MYPRTNQKYVWKLPFSTKIHKSKEWKELKRSRDVDRYHEDVQENLESEETNKKNQ